jgi:hypothetical protein
VEADSHARNSREKENRKMSDMKKGQNEQLRPYDKPYDVTLGPRGDAGQVPLDPNRTTKNANSVEVDRSGNALPGEVVFVKPFAGTENDSAQVSGDTSTDGHYESTAEGQPKWVAGKSSTVNAKDQK